MCQWLIERTTMSKVGNLPTKNPDEPKLLRMGQNGIMEKLHTNVP